MVTPTPSTPTKPADPLVGTILRPGLRLDDKLAEGTFGAVYHGRQLAVDRAVAVKVLHGWFAADDEPARLFRDEIRAIGAIDNPHVVRVYDADVAPSGRVYFVMELLRGKTLQELAARKQLPATTAVPLVIQLLHGLAAVHAAGHIHADVKPSNVVVVESAAATASYTAARVVLIDFGLARLHRPGEVTEAVGGTRAYMAPEQLSAWELDARSDVFSAALVLVWLLTGWRRSPLEEVLPPLDRLAETSDLRDPALRRALERALALDPKDRPTALDFARALGGGPLAEPAIAGPPPPFRELTPLTENDRGRLHGRDAEVLRLHRTLSAERATILTAPSGTGKTSAIRAGLIPLLDADGVDHVYAIGGPATAAELAAAITKGAPTIAAALAARNPAHRLVVILDQVEALLVADPDGPAILEALLDPALRPPGLHLEVLLGVREDFVARLVAASPALAAGAPLVRLAPLSRDGALAAMVAPLAEHGLTLESELRSALLTDLVAAGRVLGADLGWGDAEAIYPPHLQLAGAALYTALAPGETALTAAHYATLGGFDAIVGEYLDRILRELPEADRQVARELFLALVAAGQTRAIRSDEELHDRLAPRYTPAEVDRVIHHLETQRLIARRASRDGVPGWELVHDSLVPRIEAWLTVHDLDRRRAAELLRFHLRESEPATPSLLTAAQLRQLRRFPGLVDELEATWRRRATAAGEPWTPRRLVDRSRAEVRRRRIVVATLTTLGLALTVTFTTIWLTARADALREASLRDRDLGRFDLELAPFDWAADPKTGVPVMVPVDAAVLPQLTFELHVPASNDPTAPGPILDDNLFHHGARSHASGHLLEAGIDAHGGDAVLVITNRGRAGEACPPSYLPLRRLPGYVHREDPVPAHLRIDVPTCQATRFDMIDIPAGPFVYGGRGEPPAPFKDDDVVEEQSALWLPTFAIDRTEVSNAAFAPFAALDSMTGVETTGYPPAIPDAGRPNRPRTDINFADAMTYCRYLGKTIPTTEQWQKALRGGPTLPDGRPNPMPRRNLPWGASLTAFANIAIDEQSGPRAVTANPLDLSPWGVLNLAGNVQEWTRSEAVHETTGLRPRFTRGGNWADTTPEMLIVYTTTENERSPRRADFSLGVRCVLEAR